MLASDINNPDFVGAINPDSQLNVRFYSKSVQNNFKSAQENRTICDDVDYVEIMIPGDKNSVVDTPAMDHHKKRFPLHWQHYKNISTDKVEMGTPIGQWPMVTPAMAEELRYMRFNTVESIAGASDAQIDNLGVRAGMSPFTLREKAKLFLKVAQDVSIVQKQEERNTVNEAKIAELQAAILALTQAQNVPKPKTKRTYTKKVKDGNSTNQHRDSLPGAES